MSKTCCIGAVARGHCTCTPKKKLQKWSETCKVCGAVATWEAKDFFDAADKHPPGWGFDPVLKCTVCPKCKV